MIAVGAVGAVCVVVCPCEVVVIPLMLLELLEICSIRLMIVVIIA